jgi:hypothetical protein
VATYVGKSFVLPSEEIRLTPNIYEKGGRMKGHILLDQEEDIQTFACKKSFTPSKANSIYDLKDQTDIRTEMCDIIKSGNFLPLALQSALYEMDVVLNIEEPKGKARRTQLNLRLSWLRFSLNSALTKAKGFSVRKFSSLFVTPKRYLITRILAYFHLNLNSGSLDYSLITKYMIPRENHEDGVLVFEIDHKHAFLANIELVFTIKYQGIFALVNNWFWVFNLVSSSLCGTFFSIALMIVYLTFGGSFS